MDSSREVYDLLAALLEYPRADPAPDGGGKAFAPATSASTLRLARECRDALASAHPEAAGVLEDFAAFAEATPPGRLEEIYTSTFDLNASCSPYMGHWLLGDDLKRSQLLVKLRESYRAHGYEPGPELPDHLAVVLRFLARIEDAELQRDLVELVLLPTLARMAESLGDSNGYGKVIRAVGIVLGGELEGIRGNLGELRGA